MKLMVLFLVACVLSLFVSVAFGDYAYYVPYYTSIDASNTGIGIRNCSMDQPARVTILVYDRDGNQQLVQKVTVPARGQTAFTVGRDLDIEGSIRITSDQALVGLALTFMEGLAYGADIAFTQELSETLYNPHVASMFSPTTLGSVIGPTFRRLFCPIIKSLISGNPFYSTLNARVF